MSRQALPRLVALASLALAPDLAHAAAAACVAEGALPTARWILEHDYFFYLREPADAANRFSAPLRQALAKHWNCAGTDCVPLADPWTNTVGASVQEPVVFSLRTSPPERTRLALRFMLGSATEDSPELTPATAELTMVRDAESGCWQLDELVGGGGESLRRVLGLAWDLERPAPR